MNRIVFIQTYLVKYVVLLLFLATTTGCFRGQIMTDKKFAKHYKHLPVKPTFHSIQNDSVTLHYASVGSDTLPTLLLIHGAPGGWYGYMNMLDDTVLQRYFHIIAVDRLGYGKSKRKNQFAVTSIEKQAQGILPLLNETTKSQPAIVVGRSYGAAIAAQLTLLAPEKVKYLCMVAPPIDPEKEKIFWFARAARYRVVQWFLPHSFVVATAEKFAHASELRELEPKWQQLNTPLTVLQGGKDWIADPLNLTFAKKHIKCKKARFMFLPLAGHFITQTHVDLIKKVVFEAAGLSLGEIASQGEYLLEESEVK
ncbi:alpha/beta hydrolase [Cytophagaceae bacterium YF14B1]|uniref:Alpha/beta hydrolase n=1 Tax=Xanthocytophaga flava TaxID=3048013 RepID=A0AAE3QQP6_9BACT|nr:alpha/beta hydrolase [Xanthocytophaga flavus]MDJ1481450.1 alpha/beta hydrolase [Xanthocytophaga flavus]